MKQVIQFTKLRWAMIILSLVLISGGLLGYFMRGGFNLGIDFTAGLTQQIQIKPGVVSAPIDKVREALSSIDKFNLQAVGTPSDQEFIIKVRAPENDKSFQAKSEAKILDLLAEVFGSENVIIKQSDFVGPRYSKDLVGQTISITLVALVLILLYTAFRFHFIFATAAVICLIHDVFFMFGVLAIFQLEVSTTTIAAILTIIGYSLNDTIVIFDRIRENQSLMRDSDLEDIINTSITQSLSRTLLTSFTTLLAVVAIYIFGTIVIKNFALNLIIGVVVGTYSTIFIASSIVLGWRRSIDKRKKTKNIQMYGRKTPAPESDLKQKGESGAAAMNKEQVPKAPLGESGKIQITRIQPTRKKKKKKKK